MLILVFLSMILLPVPAFAGIEWSATFTGANGTSCDPDYHPEVGAGISPLSVGSNFYGGCNLQNNQAVSETADPTARGLFTFNTSGALSSADYDVQCTANMPAATNTPIILAGRVTGTGAPFSSNVDAYIVDLRKSGSSGNDTRLYKSVGGTISLLASTDSVAAADNDVVKLELRTNSQKVYINGTVVLTATDSGIGSTGTGGLGWGDVADATSSGTEVGSGWDTCSVNTITATVTPSRQMLLGVGP